MKKTNLSLIITAAIVLSTACFKIEPASVTPAIEFVSFEIFDTTDILQNQSKAGRLKFRFEDGDGDIGLAATDIADTTNLKLSLYRKTGGTMQPVADTLDPLLPYRAYRIPDLEQAGSNKVLKGEITISIIYQSYSTDDTIKYSFFITDQAGNTSNTEETAEITVSENNVYTKQ
ncbi:MAG: hypothetical protein LBV26_06375 [Bacteroidales bacterium]|jgi:hypothetical protein|nr:hypothetical protein [Bacteroidales bacterium]